MGEFLQSIKAHLYDRAVSPLFGTFAASWAAWNYQFLVVLFSSMEATEKLSYIGAALYPTLQEKLLSGLLYPTLTTAVFIFGYPHLAKPVYRYVRRQQKQLLEIKRTIEDETPLTVEESRKLRRAMLDQEREYSSQLAERETQISSLKELLSRQDESSAEDDLSRERQVKLRPPARLPDSHELDEVAEAQMRIVEFLGAHPGGKTVDEIEQYFARKLDHVTLSYSVEKLVNEVLIESAGADRRGQRLFRLTFRGRERLLQHRAKMKKKEAETAPSTPSANPADARPTTEA